MYGTVRGSENNTAPLELSLDATIPQHLHRASFFDDPDKRHFKDSSADPDFDASHAREGKQIVLNLVLLICLFCCGNRLYDWQGVSKHQMQH